MSRHDDLLAEATSAGIKLSWAEAMDLVDQLAAALRDEIANGDRLAEALRRIAECDLHLSNFYAVRDVARDALASHRGEA